MTDKDQSFHIVKSTSGEQFLLTHYGMSSGSGLFDTTYGYAFNAAYPALSRYTIRRILKTADHTRRSCRDLHGASHPFYSDNLGQLRIGCKTFSVEATNTMKRFFGVK